MGSLCYWKWCGRISVGSLQMLVLLVETVVVKIVEEARVNAVEEVDEEEEEI